MSVVLNRALFSPSCIGLQRFIDLFAYPLQRDVIQLLRSKIGGSQTGEHARNFLPNQFFLQNYIPEVLWNSNWTYTTCQHHTKLPGSNGWRKLTTAKNDVDEFHCFASAGALNSDD